MANQKSHSAETCATPARLRGRGQGSRSQAAVGQLDRLIHERIRLGLLSVLAVNESVSFNQLKQLLKTTDGNLSVHARKLEEAGYIACSKYFEGRVPKTEYRLTRQGRQALANYLDEMESLIHSMRQH